MKWVHDVCGDESTREAWIADWVSYIRSTSRSLPCQRKVEPEPCVVVSNRYLLGRISWRGTTQGTFHIGGMLTVLSQRVDTPLYRKTSSTPCCDRGDYCSTVPPRGYHRGCPSHHYMHIPKGYFRMRIQHSPHGSARTSERHMFEWLSVRLRRVHTNIHGLVRELSGSRPGRGFEGRFEVESSKGI
jgi:hypothetical protein